MPQPASPHPHVKRPCERICVFWTAPIKESLAVKPSQSQARVSHRRDVGAKDTQKLLAMPVPPFLLLSNNLLKLRASHLLRPLRAQLSRPLRLQLNLACRGTNRQRQILPRRRSRLIPAWYLPPYHRQRLKPRRTRLQVGRPEAVQAALPEELP